MRSDNDEGVFLRRKRVENCPQQLDKNKFAPPTIINNLQKSERAFDNIIITWPVEIVTRVHRIKKGSMNLYIGMAM